MALRGHPLLLNMRLLLVKPYCAVPVSGTFSGLLDALPENLSVVALLPLPVPLLGKNLTDTEQLAAGARIPPFTQLPPFVSLN